MMPKISLIISTYNWPEALHLCLRSVLRQRVLPYEIIIADDGSGDATKQVVAHYQQHSLLPINHVWQEDNGFRLSQIRNKAVCETAGEYIIQIDGDIILHPEFIADHLRMMREGNFVIGSRVHLFKEFSEAMLAKGELPSMAQLRKHGKDKLNQWRVAWLADFLRYRYKTKGKHRFTAKGCNMAYWKEQFIAVNGYNEEIVGWGSEDEEFVVRLIKSGARKQYMKMGGIAFHIYHPLISRSREEINKKILAEAINQPSHRCQLGINQYV